MHDTLPQNELEVESIMTIESILSKYGALVGYSVIVLALFVTLAQVF